MAHASSHQTNVVLLFSTFVIAVCGLVYELLAGTISSYLLGDTIYQFSIVIGLFVTSMGIGSWMSRFINDHLPDYFIAVQIAIGFIGGFSATVLFFAFSYLDNYNIFLLMISVIIGTLIGIEIPLILRILKTYRELRLNVSNVLTADYLGALGASLLFPIVLVPQLGLLRTGLLFGLLNIFVAGVAIYVFQTQLIKRLAITFMTVMTGVMLGLGFAFAEQMSSFLESRFYTGDIIFSKTTPYQRIVISRDQNAVSMFINGALQFNSLDEYRYHESLVHPAMSLSRYHDNVLILGGGDGITLREVIKYEDVKSITLVDIDPVVTRLFRENALLRTINADALNDSRVNIVNDDAWKFIEYSEQIYDVIIIDLPDPSNISLSKLYSRAFYMDVSRKLATYGVMVTQATSPFFAREAFWCIKHTLDSVPSRLQFGNNLHVLTYHVYVPTFGDWGFVIASHRPLFWEQTKVPVDTRFLNPDTLSLLDNFPLDMSEVNTEINTLENHMLAYYYDKGWSHWYR